MSSTPISNRRSGRVMTRQESGSKIESQLSAAETRGRRMQEGKDFACARQGDLINSLECLARYRAHNDHCMDHKLYDEQGEAQLYPGWGGGPCSFGHVAEFRAKTRA